jgi:tRNA-splicing ligase RtcB
MGLHPQLHRLDSNRIQVKNQYQIPATLFANQHVPIENTAVNEFLEFLEVQKTIEQFYQKSPNSFYTTPKIKQTALTPDFHKASGIPVGTVMATQGFVIPQAVGNDVNCGMRLHCTSLDKEQVQGKLDDLETVFRHLHFEGGRNIPMSRNQREGLFRNGLTGLLENTPKNLTEGLWGLFHDSNIEKSLSHIDRFGSLKAESTFGLDQFLGDPNRLTRDAQIGSIGGGNHFVEIQYVDRIIDGTTAHAWGIKKGMVTVMIHTGSVSIGHLSGGHYRDVVRNIYPKSLNHPENGVFILPIGERYQKELNSFWSALHNAANFAFANRLFLSLMTLSGLQKVCGDIDFPLLYDSPHNLSWEDKLKGEDVIFHRKGACSARGFQGMAGTPFEYYGEPVIVPGSMGASSFILAGRGNSDSLFSASHGAGRSLSRGEAGQGHEKEFQDFLDEFRVVTPVDLRRQDILLRKDIVEKKLKEIKQEAPYAYKGIHSVIDTLHSANIAQPVAELKPLMSIKG